MSVLNVHSDLPLTASDAETHEVCISDFDHVVIIDELRSQGKTVTIRHRRKDKMAFQTDGRGNYWRTCVLSPKGGQTIVQVINEDGRGSIGVSNCYHKDTFCKKQGLKRALAKALGITLTEASKKEKPCRS